MDIELKEKVKIFIELNDEFKRNLRWDGKEINCLASLIANVSEKGINEKQLKVIRKHIRKNTRFNSKFRGEFKNIFSILMNGRKDYEEVFENTKYINYSLIDRGFKDNKEAIYASFLLSKRFKGEELEDKLSKLFNIKYEIEKNKYDFLSNEDYIIYSYLTIINKDFDKIIEDVKDISLKIKNLDLNIKGNLEPFYVSLLITNLDLENKIERAIKIRKTLMGNYDFIDNDIFPLIGLSSSFVKNDDVFSKGVCNIYEMLSEKSNFNSNGLSKKSIFKISLCIVLIRYLEYIKGDIIDIGTEEEKDLIYIIEEYIVFSIIL